MRPIPFLAFVAACLLAPCAMAQQLIIRFPGGTLPPTDFDRDARQIIVAFDQRLKYDIPWTNLPHKELGVGADGKVRIAVGDPSGTLGISRDTQASALIIGPAASAPVAAAPSTPAPKAAAQPGAAVPPGKKDDQGVMDMLQGAQQGGGGSTIENQKAALKAEAQDKSDDKAQQVVDDVEQKLLAGKSDEEVKKIVAAYATDFTQPDSPGLYIVGLGTEDVVRPATPRALAGAFQSGFDKDGKAKHGVAIDFAPFKLLAPATTKKAYQSSAVTRALWNTQLSIGTAKPTNAEDKSLNAGFGLSSVLYKREESDPLRNQTYAECHRKAIAKQLKDLELNPNQLGGGGRKDAADSDAQKCYKDFLKTTWNGTALVAALATSRYSESGAWKDGKTGARGGWLSFGYGFEDLGADHPLRTNAHALLTVRRLFDEQITDPLNDKAKVEQDSTLIGAKLRWRGDDRNYFIERSYQRSSIADRPTDKIRRLSVGLEWKLGDNLWLVTALGGEGGRKNGTDSSFVTTGFKYGSATESLFGK